MNKIIESTTRKKFLQKIAAALAFIGVIKYFIPTKNKRLTTIKLLSQDGKLVEVDIVNIKKEGNKISDLQIHDWTSQNIKA
ncbi:MAG: hypothetical protein ABL929_07170 [Ferruginibacter sp.]|nr:hypothetical protein [Ferruginibacter sp.]